MHGEVRSRNSVINTSYELRKKRWNLLTRCLARQFMELVEMNALPPNTASRWSQPLRA